MADWLLGTEALHGLLSGPSHPVQQWSATRSGDALHVGRPTWAYLRSRVEGITNPLVRQDWLHELDVLVPRNFGERLLEMRPEHWKMWSTIRNTPVGAAALDTIDAMNVAMCRIEGFRYVSPRSELADVFAIEVFYP